MPEASGWLAAKYKVSKAPVDSPPITTRWQRCCQLLVGLLDGSVPILPGVAIAILRGGAMTGQQGCSNSISMFMERASQETDFGSGGSKAMAEQHPG